MLLAPEVFRGDRVIPPCPMHEVSYLNRKQKEEGGPVPTLRDVYDTMLQTRDALRQRMQADIFDPVAVELNELDLLITLAREFHPEWRPGSAADPRTQ
jgi:hypothetical protein